MLAAKMVTKFLGVYPVTRAFKTPNPEAMYTTLLMSTGSPSAPSIAVRALSHGIITQAQYSILVAGVIGSAVVPTLIANAFYLPHHLLPEPEPEQVTNETVGVASLRTASAKAD